MAEATAIEWTNSTFNPWIGCQAVSPACDCEGKRVGKKAAGRLLDGIEHNELPVPANLSQPRIS